MKCYWEESSYYKSYQYDRSGGCVFYGGPNQYSWGWVVDDFGGVQMPFEQVTGWGLYEASIVCH